jgi:1,4-dihydroxy-6-naphthoate synthase
MKLTLGFSPCPNDTFIFDALVNRKIDTEGFEFEVVLDDVQSLNKAAMNEALDITKISYAVLPHLLKNYRVLNAGGALGKGVGPLLITSKRFLRDDKPYFDAERMSVAIPGEHTTAHMLFSAVFPAAAKKQFMLFSEIEQAVLNGSADAGVIIHENRFTYMNKGLLKVLDLGEYWEEQMKLPVPLGGIVIKKSISSADARRVDRLIRRSVEYAFEHYPQLPSYVKTHSQELEEDVMRKHIDLYVNHYSLSLEQEGKSAVMKMLDVMLKEQSQRITETDIFV